MRARARDDQHIARWIERRPVAAEILAHQSPHPAADGCVADLATGRDPEPRRHTRALPRDDGEVFRSPPPATALERQILVALADSVAAWVTLGSVFVVRRLAQNGCFGGIVAASRLRPLARRRLRTRRPPGVAMRARKPWRRLRRRLLGWKVRFMKSPESLTGRRHAARGMNPIYSAAAGVSGAASGAASAGAAAVAAAAAAARFLPNSTA